MGRPKFSFSDDSNNTVYTCSHSCAIHTHTSIPIGLTLASVCVCIIQNLLAMCLHWSQVVDIRECMERKKNKKKRNENQPRKKTLSMLKCYNGKYGKSVLITLKTSNGSQVAHYLSAVQISVNTRMHALSCERMVHILIYLLFLLQNNNILFTQAPVKRYTFYFYLCCVKIEFAFFLHYIITYFV